MPGAYAHLTAVNEMKVPARLDRLGFSKPAAAALLDWFRFCELGAVSPDYPYLAVLDSKGTAWADLMHYERTGDFLQAAIAEVRALNGKEQQVAFAWLLGYVAHVSVDVTIHPVVELKVGPYKGNEKAHRICEMNQDAYIFNKRMNLGEIGVCEHLTSGVARCSDPADKSRLDPVIRGLWERSLQSVHPEVFKGNPPRMDRWHAAFETMVNKIGEEGNTLLPLARHVAVNCGLAYPSANKVDRQYIDHLKTPCGPMHYDAIFDHALESIGTSWAQVEKAVFRRDDAARSYFGNWDLDTGRDQNKKLVFWEAA